ncbi:MAG TPA: HPr family phosphocarrier protein [Cellulomonas sp.]
MPRRRARVATATGLHARPAALLTRRVAEGGHPVLIGREGQPPVDAGSILMVMGLRLEHGEDVELSAETADAEPLLDELATLLATDLDLVDQS